MKNFLKLIGIIAITIVIGFTMAACGETVDESGTAKLTITGFDFSDNGKYVQANATTDKDIYLFAVAKYDSGTRNVECGVITNRIVTLTVWEHEGGTPALYTGSDKDVVFDVYVFDTEPADPFTTPPAITETVTVSFKKGVAIIGLVPAVAP